MRTTAFVFFSLVTSWIGSMAMADVNITRIGKVEPGKITKNQFVEHTIEYEPIVLGSTRGSPTVLYLERDIKLPVGVGSISLNRIDSETSLKEKLKNAFDGYPIKFSGTALTKSQENKLDLMVEGTPTAADLDGDGEQEFVFATQQGGIEVYDQHKKRFSYKLSTGSPATSYFYFRPWCRHVARVGAKEVVFLVMLRAFYGEFDAAKKADLAKELGTYVIVRVDQNGITPLSLTGLPAEAKIQGIAAIGSSSGLDQVVTLLTGRNPTTQEDGQWVYRHRVDGTQIAPPRKTYGEEILPENVEFTFVPGSDSLVGKSGGFLYFIHPGKTVNWVRSVSAANLVGRSITEILLVIKQGDRNLAMVSEDKSLYLFDEEGRFYSAGENDYRPSRQKVALAELSPPSPYHKLAVLKGSGSIESPGLLALYVRPQQAASLEDKEVIDAADRYVDSFYRKSVQNSAAHSLDFNNLTVSEAKLYCSSQNISCPDLRSMDDVREKLPALYQLFVKQSHQKLIEGLKSWLFSPLGWGEDAAKAVEEKKSSEELVITDKSSYYRWLDSHHLPAEVVFQTYNTLGRVQDVHLLKGYSVLFSGRAIPAISSSGGKWTVIWALQKIQDYLGMDSGFYRITLGGEGHAKF